MEEVRATQRGGPRRGMALALTTSAGLHAVALWAAGWWLQPVVWHLAPIHVISVRILEGGGTPGTPSPVQTRPASPVAPLRHKAAGAVRKVVPPEERTRPSPRKILIAQKARSQPLPTGAPPPSPPRRVAAAQRLAPRPAMPPISPSSGSPPAGASGPRPGTPHLVGTRASKTVSGASSSPGPPLTVAKAEPSKGRDREARLEAIRRRIQKALVYPSAARRFGWEGTTRVRFALAPDGHPSTVTVESSSQMAVLDHEALAAVRRAAPYPYVEGTIVVPIVFDLRAPRPRIIPGARGSPY